MPRTCESDVIDIMDTSLEGYQVTPFLNMANTITTAVIGSNTDIGDSLKEEIEKALTAHIISLDKEPTVIEMEHEDIRYKFAGTFGEGLRSTRYGQLVLLLDTSGSFANLGLKNATIEVLDFLPDD